MGCEKEKPLPVPPEKMVGVLVDVHLAEAAVQHLTGIKKDTTIRKYYRQIYQIHGITESDFDSTLNLIHHDPELLRDIYKAVTDTIESRRLRAAQKSKNR